MYGNNVRTTETDTNFVANYTEKTRLGFIGTRDSLVGGFIFLVPLCCAPLINTLLSFSLSFVY